MAQPHLSRLLEMANDVEKNPGPPKVVRNGLITNKMTTSTAAAVAAVAAVAKKEAEVIIQTTAVTNISSEINNFDDLKVTVEKQNETIKSQKTEIELLRKQMEKNVHLTQDFQSELSEIRKNWQSLSDNAKNPGGTSGSVGVSSTNKSTEDIALRLDALSSAYTDIQDRLYELDKSWKNNLMIYGVPCCDGEEDDPIITEEKVKEVLLKKLHVSRDIMMNRVARLNYGPDFRGHKPIQVCLVNYRDKEEILRKARLLKGSNIYISEDFSRKVREHRNELIKFMKEVKSRDPGRRMALRYDKLYIGNDVYFFNDRSGRVERLHTPLEVGSNSNFSNLLGNDTQNSYHDSTWLRRPRSRMGAGGVGSRCPTPLSRQNSMSMEDFASSTAPRMPNSARFRRSNPGSPRKSVSIDSLHQHSNSGGHYDNEVPSQQQSRQNSAAAAHHNMTSRHQQQQSDYGLVPVADTPIPSSMHNGYYDQEPVRSNPGSPLKRVAFRGMQQPPNNYNHVMAPYNQQYEMANHRSSELQIMNHHQQQQQQQQQQDELLAIEAEPRSSYPAIMNGLNHATTTTVMAPYTNGQQQQLQHQHQRPSLPASKALVSPNNHMMNHNNSSNLPSLDYVQQALMPTMNGHPEKYIMNPAYGMPLAEKKMANALPAIMAPHNGAVEPYCNGVNSEDDAGGDQKLELEYDGGKISGGDVSKDNKSGDISKDGTTNNGMVKVAMFGEISMSNFHQCK